MGVDRTCVRFDAARASTLVEEIDLQRAAEDAGAGADGFIAVIESRAFLRWIIRHNTQSAFSRQIISYSSVSDLEGQVRHASPGLVIFSLTQNKEASVSALKVLLELVPTVPVIVLTSFDDVDLARTALRLGARGYVPVTNGFEIVIEAMRFALAEVTSVRNPRLGAPFETMAADGHSSSAQAA
jgi:DNA-binding NarL/FixJ family response regulator